jgi:hypothetical protein
MKKFPAIKVCVQIRKKIPWLKMKALVKFMDTDQGFNLGLYWFSCEIIIIIIIQESPSYFCILFWARWVEKFCAQNGSNGEIAFGSVLGKQGGSHGCGDSQTIHILFGVRSIFEYQRWARIQFYGT